MVEEKDNLVVGLMAELRQRLVDVDFEVADPTEDLEPAGDPWIILDVGMGIDRVMVVDDLQQLERVPGQSVHDFDVYLELRLKEKIGRLPDIRIVIVPFDMDQGQALNEIELALSELFELKGNRNRMT
jgi:hypothetical protein